MLKRNDGGESAGAFYDKRRQWIAFLSEHDRVGHAAFRVGYWLAMRMNGEDQCCWFSVPEIARRLGKSANTKRVSTKTVSEAVAELEGLGLMFVVRKPGKGNSYHIRLPYDLPT